MGLLISLFQGKKDKETKLTFQNGKEVGQSDVVAARWFQKAAEQGHANALDELGVCYCMALELNRNLLPWVNEGENQGPSDLLNGCKKT